MLIDESLGTVFREMHSTLRNIAGGILNSRVGKSRYALPAEASLMVTTVIRIHLKVAALFTELSHLRWFIMTHFSRHVSLAVCRTLCCLADS